MKAPAFSSTEMSTSWIFTSWAGSRTIGGLLTSTLLSLVVVPAAYSLVAGWVDRFYLSEDDALDTGSDIFLGEVARGGVGVVQVRERDLSDDALRELVQRIRAAVSPRTRLVVNSSERVARTIALERCRVRAAPGSLVSVASSSDCGGAALASEPWQEEQSMSSGSPSPAVL